jgi:hypothetical protein
MRADEICKIYFKRGCLFVSIRFDGSGSGFKAKARSNSKQSAIRIALLPAIYFMRPAKVPIANITFNKRI